MPWKGTGITCIAGAVLQGTSQGLVSGNVSRPPDCRLSSAARCITPANLGVLVESPDVLAR